MKQRLFVLTDITSTQAGVRASAHQDVTWRWWVDVGKASLANRDDLAIVMSPMEPGEVHVVVAAQAIELSSLRRYARIRLRVS